MLRKLLLLGTTCLILANCVTTTGTAGTEAVTEGVPVEAADPLAVCTVWLPIGWSTRDTDETIADVKANNRANAGWGCPQ